MSFWSDDSLFLVTLAGLSLGYALAVGALRLLILMSSRWPVVDAVVDRVWK